jgi:elongation factor G
VCDIRVEPLERGGGYEFASEVVGGAVPTNYIPSVDKGVRSQMERGLLAGYPVVDIKVVVFDGKAHSVDSSDAAFQTAGSLALKEAAANGQLVLLEPVDEVTIRIPDTYVGAVMGDLSGRRGRVQGTEPAEGDEQIVYALVPESELLRYAIDLRSLTGGRGRFSVEHDRYDVLPDHLVDAIRRDVHDPD